MLDSRYYRGMWRPALPADDAEIIAMCIELNREDPGPRPVPPEHTRQTLEVFRKEPVRGVAYVLDIDGRVQGYSLLATFWSNEVGGEICMVDEIFVRASARGRGFGRAFLQELIDRGPLWPRQAVAIDLEVTPDNHRARGFYLGLGFKPAKNTHMRMRF